MTNQLQGELLFGGWTGVSEADWAYTPWLQARGDMATFGVEVVASSGVTLTWEVQTRTEENPAAISIIVASTTSATAMTSPGSPAQQMVRYRFKTGAVSTTNFVVFRALQPSWQVDR